MDKPNKTKPGASLVVGLTGGIGAGKSLALSEFARQGARTMSLDAINRDLSRRGGAAYAKIVAAFGRDVLGPDGEIDRRRLGERVFARPRDRRALERLVHPLILREMRSRIRAARGAVVVADVPLLFEKGLEPVFDLTMLVCGGVKARRERIRKRDRLGSAEIGARMAAQWPDAAKAVRADLVVDNDGTRRDLRRKVREFYQAFALIRHGG